MTDIKETATEQLRQATWWGGAGQALPELYVEQLITEIDRLRARCARLEYVINGLRKGPIPYFVPSDDKITAIVNETPAASLSAIRADTLEELARKVGAGIDKKYRRTESGDVVCTSTSISYYITESGLMGEAAALREEKS